MSKNTISVKLVRSIIGQTGKQKASVKGLGLSKVNQVRELEDTPAVRGMVNAVSHLVKIQ